MSNNALDGARRKGREAHAAGTLRSRCPYGDFRGGRHGNIITWSRAFIRAWEDGWDTAAQTAKNMATKEPAHADEA